MESFSGPFTFTNKENTTLRQKSESRTSSRAQNNRLQPSKSMIFNPVNNNNTHDENVIHSKKINVLREGFKTPTNVKIRNHNIQPQGVKRVPLGGKDKNLIFHNNHPIQKNTLNEFGSLTSLGSSVKKRSWRLRTPKKKLNILKDDDDNNDNNNNDDDNRIINDKVNVFNENKLKLEIHFDDEIEYVPEKEPELADKPLNYEPFTDEELFNISKISQSVRLEDLTEDTGRDEIDINEEYPISFSDDENHDEDVGRFESKDSHFHFMEPTFVSNAKKLSRNSSFSEGLSTAELYRLIEEQ